MPAAQAPAAQGSWTGAILKMVMMYFIFQFLFGKNSKPATDSTGKVLPPHKNAWTSGQVMVVNVMFYVNITTNI